VVLTSIDLIYQSSLGVKVVITLGEKKSFLKNNDEVSLEKTFENSIVTKISF